MLSISTFADHPYASKAKSSINLSDTSSHPKKKKHLNLVSSIRSSTHRRASSDCCLHEHELSLLTKSASPSRSPSPLPLSTDHPVRRCVTPSPHSSSSRPIIPNFLALGSSSKSAHHHHNNRSRASIPEIFISDDYHLGSTSSSSSSAHSPENYLLEKYSARWDSLLSFESSKYLDSHQVLFRYLGSSRKNFWFQQSPYPVSYCSSRLYFFLSFLCFLCRKRSGCSNDSASNNRANSSTATSKRRASPMTGRRGGDQGGGSSSSGGTTTPPVQGRVSSTRAMAHQDDSIGATASIDDYEGVSQHKKDGAWDHGSKIPGNEFTQSKFF